jgi:hypothetical protein
MKARGRITAELCDLFSLEGLNTFQADRLYYGLVYTVTFL